MSLVDRLRSLWPLGSGERSEPPEPPEMAPEDADNVPDGYRVAAVDIEEFNDPRAFEPPVPDVGCLGCGEAFGDYWSWYNHMKDEHRCSTIEEARELSAVLVPSEHDGELETGNPTESASGGKPSPSEVFDHDG
jgi:hypothetical protein